MKLTTLILSLIFSTALLAQENNTHAADTGKVTIIQDNRIDALLQKKTEVNKKTDGKTSGYRVQIHFGGDSQEAKKIKADFISAHGEIPAYYIYEQPNFKIRVGDFKTKLEAQKLLKEIKGEFPSSFVVEDKIEMMKLD